METICFPASLSLELRMRFVCRTTTTEPTSSMMANGERFTGHVVKRRQEQRQSGLKNFNLIRTQNNPTGMHGVKGILYPLLACLRNTNTCRTPLEVSDTYSYSVNMPYPLILHPIPKIHRHFIRQ